MMNQRVYTVGSLIPGRMVLTQTTKPEIVELPSPPIKIKSEPITIMQNEQKFEITPTKGNLLEIALKQGNPIKYKCQKGTCGQCTVKMIQGKGLSEPNEKEWKKLDGAIKDGYRLACQVEII
jgi:ferredoxin, 2Fe-2S